jgi:filamentous hemagglutinin family protein
MNKNLYRIVFNARRGMRMVVSEIASTQGKPASGNTQGPGVSASNQPLARIDIARAAIKSIVSAVALLGLPLLLQAQVVADRTAPGNQQPTILQTASGVTQVNIQAPSAAGVSRNTYSQFDVSRQGVVLNNSRTDTNTQIAGYVQGNPWLGGSGARVILNEVNSANASQIRGYVEVAGQRAEVIIANPAGIAVNGGGFINASAVTLTTGTPVLNAGNLESFQVRGGSVVVDGDGLDTRTADYTNILTRATQINAGIWAKDIKVVTGANDISANSAANPSATAAAGTGIAPAFALDVAALGGMYAQKITLVGTEAGLGVRNGGVIGATAGDVTVNSQGWLSNSGTISAVGSTRIQTQGDVTNTGDIVATDTARLDTAATLRNRGLIDSGNAAGTSQTQIKATTVENLGSARIYGDTVSVAATTLTNDLDTASSSTAAATLASRQSLNIGVDTLNNRNGANILSLGDMAIGASLDANGQATGSATTLTNSASTIEAQGTLRIHSATINNLNPLLEWEKDAGTAGASGTVYFTTGGTFDSAQGAVPDPAMGSLTGMSHGGYAYYRIVGYEPEMICTGGGHDGCTNHATGNMLPVYGYGKGAAQADSTSGAYSFDGFASYVQTDYRAVVTRSTPGRIASGADMTLVASTGVVNDQSMIVSGGALTITAPSIDNRARTIQLDSVRSGTSYSWAQYDEGCGNVKGCNYNYQAYRPGAYSSAVASTQVLDTSVRQAASTVPLTAPGTTPSAQTGINLPNSSLLRIQSDPSAPVLVQTDPRFTNYRSWLSSDYITSRISLDPSVTQKRLGDGFYEQRLINEQVAQLTGRRFLANYTSDQQQYQALMDSGLTFAQTYNLRPGIALTAEQMAVLTTDIVWLQQETVTLPGVDGKPGTTTQVLVPHLYAAVRPGDLNATGGLLSGNTVAINSSGEVRNGGTILGRTLLEINANTINNLGGQIAANDVKLSARQDPSTGSGGSLNITGGSVTAQNSLIAVADKDINVTSTTGSTSGTSGNYTYSRTGLDRMAGLYVAGPGTLLASAGNDLNIIGATVQGAGDTQLSAGNTVNLDTLQASQSNNFGAGDAKNHLLTSQTSDVGSTVKAGKALTITAGQNVIAKAADLKAQGDVNIAAQGTVLLNAGQTRSSFDSVMTKSSSDLISTTTTRTQTQASAATAQVSKVQGKNVNITAGRNLVSVGTQFKGADSLRVAGKDTSTFYAATDVHQISTTTHTKTDLGAAFSAMLDPLGFGTPIEEKTVTDARATSTSIGTRLISDQKIEIGVGNKTELQGAKVEAQQIAFVNLDPSKNGELILGGSTDTTQTSHTEKTVTMGLYQEMKGKGSTTETLNQTQLKGNVSFDSALKITAQIPNTPAGQTLKTQIATLVSEGNGVGLDYLNALAANPNVKWDQVALAHEKWSYDQGGLTGAGAALLTIVVTYFTAGMGTAAVGGTAATAGSAATVMGSTAMATAVNAGFSALASQAAVAMVNNKGDIGKTLEQLGSEQSVQNLLTSMLTAGALDKLNASYFQGVDATSTFGTQLLKNVTNNLASDMMNSALTGRPFDEASLQKSLAGALTTTGMAQGAFAIGEGLKNGDLNAFTHKLAHAVLGCAGGAAIAGNSSGCAPGAVGAVVGEMAAQFYNPSGDPTKTTDTVNFAKIMAGIAGVVIGGGGDNVQAVNIAATAGANAAENNRQLHPDERRLAARLAAQSKGLYTVQQIEDAMRNSGNGKLGEGITTGMVVNPNDNKAIYDNGAQWNVGGDGKTLVQVLPNGSNVAPNLAAFIAANTGGGNSPYAWPGYQLGQTTPSSVDPNAAVKWQGSPGWSYMGANGTGMAPGVTTDNRTQAQIDASLSQTTTLLATSPVWAPIVGAAAIYSPLGFSVGVGGDAAGQAYQSYTSTGSINIRPVQSIFSGVTGAVVLPLTSMLPAVSLSGAGAASLSGNAVAGGATAVVNTQFNNIYYDEVTSLSTAGGLGAIFGLGGSVLGTWANNVGATLFSNTARIPATGSVGPIPAQGILNPLPAQIGNTVSNTIGAIPAFIPLDNGAAAPNANTPGQTQ